MYCFPSGENTKRYWLALFTGVPKKVPRKLTREKIVLLVGMEATEVWELRTTGWGGITLSFVTQISILE